MFFPKMPESKKGDQEKHGFFDRYGATGRVYPGRFARRMRRVKYLRPYQKEYVTRLMERFHSPTSRGITKKEFEQGLQELKTNKRDRITDRDIEKIKKAFQ